jgi:hypothetical protein
MTQLNHWALDPEYRKLFEKHFDIISIIETKQFDCGKLGFLIDILSQTKKDCYGPKDRYIIVHFDTDFYWHGHGINLNNLFTVWDELDIPFYTMIYYTNHFGIQNEIAGLCKNRDITDRPMVIETVINPINYSSSGYTDLDANIDCVTRHALCMMAGNKRSHRFALYNHLKHHIPNHIVASINGENKKCT